MGVIIDAAFFVGATAATVVFAVYLLRYSFSFDLLHLLVLVPFWVIVAYLLLPRIHKLLTSIYVPAYFFGRARTSDGLLGDPINLAVDGTARQIHAAMTRAGWHVADDVTVKSSVGIIRSAVLKASYPNAPVSPLMVFGRKQCLSYQQEVDGNASQRHHVRFWRCPDGWFLPGGARVGWLGGGTYDKSVGLSLFTLQVTHKIDENIDIERDHIVSCLEKANPEVTHHVIENFSTGYHSRNGGGDLIVTDGHLPVIDVTGVDPGQLTDDLPPQVLRAAAGYDVPEQVRIAGHGGCASPDDDVDPEVLDNYLVEATRQVRPWTLVLGVVMAVATVLVEALGTWIFAAEAVKVLGEQGFVALVAGLLVLWGLVVWAAGHTFTGSVLSRISLMVLAVVSLGLSAVAGQFTQNVPTSPVAQVIPVVVPALNLVLLLALSGDAAREWSRIVTTRRYRNKKRPAKMRRVVDKL
ncbi:LssY C-terminal domain-containing protein [Corynebacterium sp. CCM 8862]|uniref:LssY C-terminal domain-containing protein n=1 Tax=Corynebacterium mendelii TaxID=2765362 RepID=A0A939E163_9CORY|nr:LssY C-terminal domain-containing protein [Corynebacterium mendelii]